MGIVDERSVLGIRDRAQGSAKRRDLDLMGGQLIPTVVVQRAVSQTPPGSVRVRVTVMTDDLAMFRSYPGAEREGGREPVPMDNAHLPAAGSPTAPSDCPGQQHLAQTCCVNSTHVRMRSAPPTYAQPSCGAGNARPPPLESRARTIPATHGQAGPGALPSAATKVNQDRPGSTMIDQRSAQFADHISVSSILFAGTRSATPDQPSSVKDGAGTADRPGLAHRSPTALCI